MARTINERAQFDSTKYPAINVPKMFPTDVCEFQTPKMKPILKKKQTPLIPSCKYLSYSR